MRNVLSAANRPATTSLMIIEPLKNAARFASRQLPDRLQRQLLVQRRSLYWRRAGVLFIHVPKCAGTSINLALYGRFMGHPRAADIERWGSQAVRSLPRIAVVRNPWDRLVSAYRFVKRGAGVGGGHQGAVKQAEQYQAPEFATFERFVKDWLAGRDLCKLDRAFHPQSLYVCDDDGTVLLDHLGRYEDLSSTEAFLRNLVPDMPAMSHSNKSGDAIDYRSFYTSELVDIVALIYPDDIQQFGYKFST